MSTDQTTAMTGGGSGGAGEIMLFGFRVVVDSMRKSVSLNDLSQYEHRLDSLSSNDKDAVAVGYASADEAVHLSSSAAATATATASAVSRERKRGVPWTEDEHKLFLLGLQKVGKGDWRGISRNFVKTRTPTQVASHAQKYFLRRSNLNRRRRRSSLFDITTDTVAPKSDDGGSGGSQSPPPLQAAAASSEVSNVRFSAPETARYPAVPDYSMSFNNYQSPSPVAHLNMSEMKHHLIRPVPVHQGGATSSKSMADFDMNDNSSSLLLSLKLSLSMSPPDLVAAANSSASTSSSRHSSAFQVMQGFGNGGGDSIISVA